MTFNFPLPTTSPVSFSASFASSSAPSLPFAATTHRSTFCSHLKAYKRLPSSLSSSSSSVSLQTLQNSIDEYLPYLHTLDAYITSEDVTQISDFQTSWRATLSKRGFIGSRGNSSGSGSGVGGVSGGDAPRVIRKGLDYEVCFATATAAYVLTFKARSLVLAALQGPKSSSSSTYSGSGTSYDSSVIGSNDSTSISNAPPATLINQASSHLLTAASIFIYLQNRTTQRQLSLSSISSQVLQQQQQQQAYPPDLQPPLYTSLISLLLASATLLAVIKEDPYPSFVATEHDPTSKEWMYKSPTVPTGKKALLMARLCIEASDLASKAAAGIGSIPGINPDLKSYSEDLSRTARARGCRFLGVDAEAQGRIGEAIGWVRTGREILGFTPPPSLLAASSSSSAANTSGDGGDPEKKSLTKGLVGKLKHHREEKKFKAYAQNVSLKLQPASIASDDGGRMEEGMVLSALEKRWGKVNDSVTFQTIPGSGQLLPKLPSGRSIHEIPKAWSPPRLSLQELSRLQSQTGAGGVEGAEWLRGAAEDSDDGDADEVTLVNGMSGPFRGATGSGIGYY